VYQEAEQSWNISQKSSNSSSIDGEESRHFSHCLPQRQLYTHFV
jgi:hypothetical protein